MPTTSPVHTLSIHADYRCRHTGACCTAGWRIPVDAPCEQGLAIADRRGQLPHAELERNGDLAVLPLTEAGACVFYREPPPGAVGRCTVHAAIGHEALPLACRQFPRVSLVDQRGTFVTLSHFCPTAAGLLLRDHVPLAIVREPAAFPSGAEYDALDARDVLPPLLRPDMLMDLPSFAAWEASAVALLAEDRLGPEDALARVALMTEHVRAWTPSQGALPDRVHQSASSVDDDAATALARHDPAVHCERLALANASLPDGFKVRALPQDFARVDAELVEPAWRTFGAPVRRYLAARLFGSWLAYQGRGLRTMMRALEVAVSMLRLECARACECADRPLDRELFTCAVRESDRFLVHEISSLAFARQLSALESKPITPSARA